MRHRSFAKKVVALVVVAAMILSIPAPIGAKVVAKTPLKTQTLAVMFDGSEPAAKEAAEQIYAILSKHYPGVDYLSVSSLKDFKEKLKNQHLASVYIFHGTPEGMKVGDEEIPWKVLAHLLEASPTKWHVVESCYSMNMALQNVHGIGGGVDVELAMIDALYHVSEYLGKGDGTEERMASQEIRKEFDHYVVNNLQRIVEKAFLPEKTLDESDETQYEFTAPWGGKTTVSGPWGWLFDKIIWVGQLKEWIEIFEEGGKGYIGFRDLKSKKIEVKKPNLGHDGFNFDMPLEFKCDEFKKEGPWYSPEQLVIKISATPKTKIDLAKITGLSAALKKAGIKVEFLVVPRIHTGILIQDLSWFEVPEVLGGNFKLIDTIQVLGGVGSIELKLEVYIPVCIILDCIIPGTGTAIGNTLKFLGIEADVVNIMDLITGSGYNAVKDASEESIKYLLGIGLLIKGDTDIAGRLIKDAIGISLPISFVKLGFKVKGDSGFASRAVLDSDGAKFQVGLPYELLLDFWAQIFWFFKFGWDKKWEDILWYPEDGGKEIWTLPVEKDNSIKDSDKDGLGDKAEEEMGLDTTKEDNDGDGRSDGWDTDGDGLSDGNELTEYYTNPNNEDSDDDGLKDKEELDYWYVEAGHDPLLDYDHDKLPCLLDKDSDNDGLKDGGAEPTVPCGGKPEEEPGERTFGTDPSLPDTDFDRLKDGEEVGWAGPFGYVCGGCQGIPQDCVHWATVGPYQTELLCTEWLDCVCMEKYPEEYFCWCRYPDGPGGQKEERGCTCETLHPKKWVYWCVTDPRKKDTDDDGLIDGDEREYFEEVRLEKFPYVENGGPYEDFDGDRKVNIVDPDSDNDGLLDGEEVRYGTDPLDIDTDGDYDLNNNGFIDPEEELKCCGIVPRFFGDLSDSGEINGNEWPGYANWGTPEPPECAYPWPVPTDPTKADSDDDDWSDWNEWNDGTNPITIDSDGDGLSNQEEYYTYGTDCTTPDTDGDGLRDGFERDYFREVKGVTDDTTLGQYLNNPDVDDDRLPDGHELIYGTDILDADTDEDKFLDMDEISYRTDPLDPDTDGDGLEDGVEVWQYGTDPLKVDTDGDGLTDDHETQVHETELLFVGKITYKTDPLKPDTDDDGISDGDEVLGWHWAINRTVKNGKFPSSSDELWGKHVIEEEEWWKWKWNRERVYDFPDPYRARFQTNPQKPDTDGDGLTDGEEKDMVLSPLTNDTDVDGIPDLQEMELIQDIVVNLGWERDDWKKFDIWHYLDFDKDKDDLHSSEDGLTDHEELLVAEKYNIHRKDHASWDKIEWQNLADLLFLRDADDDGLTDWEEVRVPITSYDEEGFTKDEEGNVIIKEEYLFSIDVEWEEELDKGIIPSVLKDKLSTLPEPIELSESATVDKTAGGEWVITDPIPDVITGFGKKFIVRKEGGGLKVFGIFYDKWITKNYTNPLNPDTDGDGLTDGDEVKKYFTNPLEVDTDNDGLDDYQEVRNYHTDPLNPDTDNDAPFDGWTDGVELEQWQIKGVTDTGLLGQYLRDPDCDDDGIVDGVEFMKSSLNPLYSDPLNPDVDSNIIFDGLQTDYDGDGLSDWFELYKTPPGYTQPTMESLKASFIESDYGQEYYKGCYEKCLADCTAEPDCEKYCEEYCGLPRFDDSALSVVYHTWYFDPDTDKDGFKDGDEVNIYHTDPLNSSDYPGIHNPNTGKYFTTIQAAIDDLATKAGDTITLEPRIYTENVDVSKQLKIRSASGDPEDTIVEAKDPDDHVFEVTANYVEISGLTLRGGYTGIYLNYADHCQILDNIIEDTYRGIHLIHSSNNEVKNNKIMSMVASAITLEFSSSNLISDNEISENAYGIKLGSSPGNKVSNNSISGSTGYGIYLMTINGGVSLPNVSNNSIISNNVSSNWGGIDAADSPGNTISKNNVSNNQGGIYLDSPNNTVYLNNFIDNTDNAYPSALTNMWNSSQEITYTYKGNRFTNYLGNYWSDYEVRYPDAQQIDSTGIWNTPYSIDGDKDNYPLVEPFENYLIETCEGDFDCDGDVDGSDLAVFSDAYVNHDPKADLNEDEEVNVADLAVFAADFGRINCPPCAL